MANAIRGGHRHSSVMALGPAHALLKGLREPRSETELTRVLAETLAAHPSLAAGFVKAVLRRSERPDGARRTRLRTSSSVARKCRSRRGGSTWSSGISGGRGWLASTRGAQDRRRLRLRANRALRPLPRSRRRKGGARLDHARRPKVRRRPSTGHRTGRARSHGRRASTTSAGPADPTVAEQRRLLFDILEDEGSMGVTRVEPELLRALGAGRRSTKHAVAYMEGLRTPLLISLQEALNPAIPSLAAGERATQRRRRQRATAAVDVESTCPRRRRAGGGELWAWKDFRFGVSARYPSDDRSAEARQAIAHLAARDLRTGKPGRGGRCRSTRSCLTARTSPTASLSGRGGHVRANRGERDRCLRSCPAAGQRRRGLAR